MASKPAGQAEQAQQAELGSEEAEWETVAAVVQRLEAAVGPQEAFFR